MADGEVWVFAEQREGRLQDIGLELLGEGRKLAERLEVQLGTVLLGSNVASLCQVLLDFGADKVYIAEDPTLYHYLSEPYVHVLHQAIVEYEPQIFLIGATAIGTDLAPGLAARLGTGLSADCIGLEIDGGGKLLQIVPAFGGGMMATIVCPQYCPQMATVRPGVMKKLERKEGDGVVVRLTTTSLDRASRVKIVNVLPASRPQGKAIEEARVVVTGGWGIGDAKNWGLITKLADILDGAVGATRPAVDEGWAEEEQMIGQSGKIVRPDLYIGVGISGAMHHMVGIQESKLIVAINSDPKAQIFKDVDIGLVGDLREIIPYLIDEIGKRKRRDEA